jgi:hypothetical protein
MRLEVDLDDTTAMLAGAQLIASTTPEVAQLGARLLTQATAELRRQQSRHQLARRWYELQAAYADALTGKPHPV